MSRYRNRNIRNKFYIPSVSSGKNETSRTADSGIDVKPVYSELPSRLSNIPSLHHRVTLSPTTGSEIDIREDDATFGRSSGSSISWSEDYEMQSTELVKEEYGRMERVLQCLEPIPPNYDRDEYKLWIKTFPFLSITGQSTVRSTKSHSLSRSPPAMENCDKTTSAVTRRKTTTNLAVIDKLLGELFPVQKHPVKNVAVNNTINPRTLDVAFGSFLQIAPVTFPKKPSTSKPIWWEDFIRATPKPQKKDFIVLPPIDSAASPLETGSIHLEERGLHNNKRKSRFVELNQE